MDSHVGYASPAQHSFSSPKTLIWRGRHFPAPPVDNPVGYASRAQPFSSPKTLIWRGRHFPAPPVDNPDRNPSTSAFEATTILPPANTNSKPHFPQTQIPTISPGMSMTNSPDMPGNFGVPYFPSMGIWAMPPNKYTEYSAGWWSPSFTQVSQQNGVIQAGSIGATQPVYPGTSTTASTPLKLYKGPKPNCIKRYVQKAGLQYHLACGSCDFVPLNDAGVAGATEGGNGVVQLCEANEEEIERHLAPLACGLGDCRRRYTTMRGLRSHYRREHGAVGLRMAARGVHEYLKKSRSPSTPSLVTSKSRGTISSARGTIGMPVMPDAPILPVVAPNRYGSLFLPQRHQFQGRMALSQAQPFLPSEAQNGIGNFDVRSDTDAAAPVFWLREQQQQPPYLGAR